MDGFPLHVRQTGQRQRQLRKRAACGWLRVLAAVLMVATRSPAQFTFNPIGQITLPGATAFDVAVAGNYAYVDYEPIRLFVYDVSNPSKPTLAGGVTNFTYPEGLGIAGDFLYQANGSDGLWVFNISNPTNLVKVCQINNGGQAHNFVIKSNLLCLANGTDGLRLYDISNPTNVVSLGHIYNSDVQYGAACNVAVSGNLACVANRTDGLRTYDISNPANIINLGHTNDGTAMGVAIAGNYALVMHPQTAGLIVYDVSDPTNPRKVSQVAGNGPGICYHVPVVAGSYAYTTLAGALRVFAVSALPNLIEVGHTNVPPSISDPPGWAISGDYLYVASFGYGLRIWSLAGPKLDITTTPTNTVLLTWPSNYLTFALQQNSNLATANWTPVEAADTFTNGEHRVTVPLSESSLAYRLKLQ